MVVYSTNVRFGRTFPANQVGIPLIVKMDTGVPTYEGLNDSLFEAEFLRDTVGLSARDEEELKSAHDYIVELCGQPKSTAELGVLKSGRLKEILFYEDPISGCPERGR